MRDRSTLHVRELECCQIYLNMLDFPGTLGIGITSYSITRVRDTMVGDE